MQLMTLTVIRYCFLGTLLLVLFVDFGVGQDIKTPPGKPPSPIKTLIDQEDYRVYETVIKSHFEDLPQQLVIIDEVGGCGAPSFFFESHSSKFPQGKFEEIAGDCETKKTKMKLDAKSFQLESKVKLIDQQELDGFFSGNCDVGWKKFYEKYPNSNGNMPPVCNPPGPR